ncbi:hypothetical protein DFJ73DRAFT_835896 [Zopfochytrium polystomum]|nr:hypothetical protein DFJ73DRAFT_835896 [Zopfochytrium polystomum]
MTRGPMPSLSSSALARRVARLVPPLEVSSPHPLSAIRMIRHPSSNEPRSDAMREWQRRREQVQEMHHKFWAGNNADFIASKTSFEQKILESTGAPADASDLSRFYREYLDGARDRHRAYRRAWNRENFGMLGVALRAYADVAGRVAVEVVESAGAQLRQVDRSIHHAITKLSSRPSSSLYRAHGVSVR